MDNLSLVVGSIILFCVAEVAANETLQEDLTWQGTAKSFYEGTDLSNKALRAAALSLFEPSGRETYESFTSKELTSLYRLSSTIVNVDKATILICIEPKL
ncbi:hypothetical protein [Vibrio sp. CyArs1]|uniref:hypothetical protein n=1 Tax=Vibrio sp. CyArs1 TaxID=2682577 RepID=UPI001F05B795|nr:hypothetical protein [Vibrio sp. CyArs1]